MRMGWPDRPSKKGLVGLVAKLIASRVSRQVIQEVSNEFADW